ncbi:MAG: sigma-54-dependent Fis family transcriptional regulator [Deltaproteobacteria bacterium]|nr:sigma-54-dependent Fis family transcriptional regulator [Deltaproteobacteria bacterium]MCW5806831.1 sigma-54-dependent Fis family transcriptional regulator [Deltaproteobacteria bacterium]
MANILVVDDEQSMREFLAICLKRAGHAVTLAEGGTQALERLAALPIDVVVTDLKMPDGIDGLGLLHAIKSGAVSRAPFPSAPPAPVDPEVILVTAFATAETALAAMKQGAYDYLTKPFQVDEINAVIGRALEKRALVEDNLALRDQLAGRARLAQLLGRSRAMQRVFELIGKIHSAKTTVLVTGESGTGKELVARALHSEGNRAHRTFVAVNCGAIPEELMESELFGHKKGAFTGAVADKPGLFQEAAGGTLFLDEIGELSLSLQVKLLRALQERRVKSIGATEELEVDVRVIAATNRDLEAEVARGAFRADLYYRLNVIEVRLPPLRQRREDIPLLADHFLRRFGAEHGRPMRLSAEAMRRLESYDFPGNVRELENLIERAVALSSSNVIGPADLPAERTKAVVASEAPEQFPAEGVDLERLVSDFERSWVARALEHTGGVRKRAATLLGISFRSLRYRLAKLGIDKDGDAEEPEAG